MENKNYFLTLVIYILMHSRTEPSLIKCHVVYKGKEDFKDFAFRDLWSNEKEKKKNLTII